MADKKYTVRKITKDEVNDTLQDRLVKEMRLKGISTIDEGNRFLPEFTKEFNKRFAVAARKEEDAHRPLLPSEDLLERYWLISTR